MYTYWEVYMFIRHKILDIKAEMTTIKNSNEQLKSDDDSDELQFND